MRKKLFTVGTIGTLISALCCFTPLAVILLGAIGLSSLASWLDMFLIPALVMFVALTIYAVVAK